ncbi:MAG: DNA polymerase III subunit delta [Thermodesulfovibrionales bacterium]|nr:DNA polymerase III subunit delta [Thermodesulfovibrionales bacterium]
MNFNDFYFEAKKCFPSSTYLISSQQDFILYESQTLIKERLNAWQSLNFVQFDLDSIDEKISIADIIEILNTLPFLNERRIVFLKNVQKISKRDLKKLEDYINDPASFSVFFMFCKGDPKKVFPLETLSKIRTIKINLQGKEIYTWIKEKAKSKNITLTDEAIEYLIEMVGDELFKVNSEIEKLTLIGKNHIDIIDLKDNIYQGGEFDAFDLIQAIESGNKKLVFRIYHYLQRDMEPYMLLGALNWHYRKLYVKAPKAHQPIYGKIFALLHEADFAIKSSHPNVIDNLLIKILQTDWKIQ